ncbi:DUF5329 family protein [Thalassotalea aquiviva]
MASLEDEINHLLSYVNTIDCLYEHNGTLHKGAEAKQHIMKSTNTF